MYTASTRQSKLDRVPRSNTAKAGMFAMSTPGLVGVDGCPGGWIVVAESDDGLNASVHPDWMSVMRNRERGSLIAVDIPIGLPASGARLCDIETRAYLGGPRSSSVFPTPVRACLVPGSYEEVSARHRSCDGRGLSRQAFNLLPKIRQVDQYLLGHAADWPRIWEVHPEVSFKIWNAGCALQHRKTHRSGRNQRESLIDSVWKGERERIFAGVKGTGCRRDDLNDAFAALWSARRIASGLARKWPETTDEADERGLRMQISG